MANNNLLVVLGIIVVVEVALAAGIVHLASDGGSDGGDEVYTLYIGMQDSTTHVEYDPEVVDDTVDKIVLDYSEGLTRFQAMGSYTYSSGELAHETSLVYILAGISLDDVHAIADRVKEELNQESIMITITSGTVEFY